MAGDWTSIDLDLPEKPETQKLIDLTGESVERVCYILFLFWRWVERQCADGFIPGASAKTLARVVGGTEAFWVAMTDRHVNWLVITPDGIEIPGFERRFSKAAKKRMVDARNKAAQRRGQPAKCPQFVESDSTKRGTTEQNRTEQNRDIRSESDRDSIGDSSSAADHKEPDRESLKKAAPLVEELFKRIGYEGADGKLLWQVGFLVEFGGIAKAWAIDAAEGARICGKKNRVGYFRTVLAERCSQNSVNLGRLLSAVVIPAGFNPGPPEKARPPPQRTSKANGDDNYEPRSIGAIVSRTEAHDPDP